MYNFKNNNNKNCKNQLSSKMVISNYQIVRH